MLQTNTSATVSVRRSATIQVKQFHPMTIEIGLTLPILAEESAESAIERVDEIVLQKVIEKVSQLNAEGKAILEA